MSGFSGRLPNNRCISCLNAYQWISSTKCKQRQPEISVWCFLCTSPEGRVVGIVYSIPQHQQTQWQDSKRIRAEVSRCPEQPLKLIQELRLLLFRKQNSCLVVNIFSHRIEKSKKPNNNHLAKCLGWEIPKIKMRWTWHVSCLELLGMFVGARVRMVQVPLLGCSWSPEHGDRAAGLSRQGQILPQFWLTAR